MLTYFFNCYYRIPSEKDSGLNNQVQKKTFLQGGTSAPDDAEGSSVAEKKDGEPAGLIFRTLKWENKKVQKTKCNHQLVVTGKDKGM